MMPRHPQGPRCLHPTPRSGSGSSPRPWMAPGLSSPVKHPPPTRPHRTWLTCTSGLTATYTDKHGDDKTAMAVSAHARSGRSPPVITPPLCSRRWHGIVRKVKENSPPGTNVGKPVTAGDAGDILTYSLTGTENSSDHAMFRHRPGHGPDNDQGQTGREGCRE